jgi:hypothetical protein
MISPLNIFDTKPFININVLINTAKQSKGNFSYRLNFPHVPTYTHFTVCLNNEHVKSNMEVVTIISIR